MKKRRGRPTKIPPLPEHLSVGGRISLVRKKVEGGAIGDYGTWEGDPCVSLNALTGSEQFDYVKRQRAKGRIKGSRIANGARKEKAKNDAEARQGHIRETYPALLASSQSTNRIAKEISGDKRLGGCCIRLLAEDIKALRKSLQG
jgi:hypothetical protein